VQEIEKDIENPGLDLYRLTAPAQLVEAFIEFKVVEVIEHGSYSEPFSFLRRL
jgi:hypothetical protein